MFYFHGGEGDWAGGPGWGWWLLMAIAMIAFWGLIAWAIIWLIRGNRSHHTADSHVHVHPGPAAPARDDPEEILRRRLAAGEIPLEEYERVIAALHRPPSSEDTPPPAGPS